MDLRAVIVGWPEPTALQGEERSLLADLLERTVDTYPPDGEVPTADAAVPQSSVAASRSKLEDSYSVVAWSDSPLGTAERVVCFEGPDPAQLGKTAAMWSEPAKGTIPELTVMPVGVRDRAYTSPTIAGIAYERALGRQSRDIHPQVLLWSFKRTPQWWDLSPLQRQALFLPRLDPQGEVLSPGHIEVSAPLVSIIHRRLYHETMGDGVTGVMMGWFETSPQHLETLKQVVNELQDVSLTPDHGFYYSGPLWWGNRISVQGLMEELSA